MDSSNKPPTHPRWPRPTRHLSHYHPTTSSIHDGGLFTRTTMAPVTTAEPSTTAGGVIARYEFTKPVKLERSYSCPVRRTIRMSPDKPDIFSNRMSDIDLSGEMSSLALNTPGGGSGAGEGTMFDLKFQFTSRSKRREQKRRMAKAPTASASKNPQKEYFTKEAKLNEESTKTLERPKKRRCVKEESSDASLLLRLRDDENKTWGDILVAFQNRPQSDMQNMDIDDLRGRYEAMKRAAASSE